MFLLIDAACLGVSAHPNVCGGSAPRPQLDPVTHDGYSSGSGPASQSGPSSSQLRTSGTLSGLGERMPWLHVFSSKVKEQKLASFS